MLFANGMITLHLTDCILLFTITGLILCFPSFTIHFYFFLVALKFYHDHFQVAHMSSRDLAAKTLTYLLYASMLSLNYTEASKLAGDSMLGSFSIDITLIRMDSAPKIGLHLSSAFS